MKKYSDRRLSSRDLEPVQQFLNMASYWMSFTIHSAVKIGILREILRGKGKIADLATSLRCNPFSLKLLLDALCSIEVLTHSHGYYGLGPKAPRSEEQLRYIDYCLQFDRYRLSAWESLHESVRKNKPAVRSIYKTKSRMRTILLRRLHEEASMKGHLIAAALTRKCQLMNWRKMLDLGGGTGAYSSILCSQNPRLESTLFDLPQILALARRENLLQSLDRRILIKEGDYLRDDYGDGYDAVFLSNVMHQETPESIRAIFSKCYSSLSPSGMLLIHDRTLNDDGISPSGVVFFSLYMLLTSGARCYQRKEVTNLLHKAGFVRTRWVIKNSLLCAHKPA